MTYRIWDYQRAIKKQYPNFYLTIHRDGYYVIYANEWYKMELGRGSTDFAAFENTYNNILMATLADAYLPKP